MKRQRARVFLGALSALALVVLLVLGAPSTAAAGRWAIASFDEIPTMEAGTPVDVGFTILQHGVRPVDTDTFGAIEGGGATKVKGEGAVGVTVEADGVTTFFPGSPTGAPGHYMATVEARQPGTVTMHAEMGWFGASEAFQVEVMAADGGSSGGGGLGWDQWPDWRVVAIAAMLVVLLAVLAFGLVIPHRRREPWKAAHASGAVASDERTASHLST